MDTIEDLRAEVARLRAVCEAHDVDPDWTPEPDPLPVHTVPTLMEWQLQKMMQRANDRMVEALLNDRQNYLADLAFVDGMHWPNTLRIRAPADFKVQQ